MGFELQALSILIRADASSAIGTGHVMRCLALAKALRQQGYNILFACRELQGDLCAFLEEQQFKVHRLPAIAVLPQDWQQDVDVTLFVVSDVAVDCVIVDHYQLDARWESAVRAKIKHILAIDDLADREHDCDLLLDQNLYADMHTRYDALVSQGCERLLGPKFALLRDEFLLIRQHLRIRDGQVRRILIFFGGSDPSNETQKTLNALHFLDKEDIALDVVVGLSNPYRDEIKKLCSKYPSVSYHCQAQNMADLMQAADLAIGAGGSASWERCCVGLPAILISVADNQYKLAEACANAGAAVFLGASVDVSAERIKQSVEALLKSPAQLRDMTAQAIKLVDARGVQRVMHQLEGILS